MTLTSPASSVAAQPLLSVVDLRIRFHLGRTIVHAVNGVSFTLRPGRTLAIVGESGSGKSVTCLSLLRLLPPAAEVTGTVLWQGRDLLTAPDREVRRLRGSEIALVYQDPMAALNPVRTIGVQLREPLRIHLGMRRRAANERAVELLNMVGIPEPRRRLRSYPDELSGGMRQRVVIAMALACNPKVLLADEPTTALDVSVQAQILELLKRLSAEFSISLLLISHDMSVVAGLADDVAVMYGGFIVEHGDALSVFQRPRHPYTAGLLASIPETAADPDAPLRGIPGQPPDPRSVPADCAFRARCPLAMDQCAVRPPLAETGPGHRAACWADAEAVLEYYGRGAAHGSR